MDLGGQPAAGAAQRLPIGAGFLSFDQAPRIRTRTVGHLPGELDRRAAAGPCGVLMSTHHGGIHPHRPLLGVADIAATTQLIEHRNPRPIT